VAASSQLCIKGSRSADSSGSCLPWHDVPPQVNSLEMMALSMAYPAALPIDHQAKADIATELH